MHSAEKINKFILFCTRFFVTLDKLLRLEKAQMNLAFRSTFRNFAVLIKNNTLNDNV
jgi:hypothetical protein